MRAFTTLLVLSLLAVAAVSGAWERTPGYGMRYSIDQKKDSLPASEYVRSDIAHVLDDYMDALLVECFDWHMAKKAKKLAKKPHKREKFERKAEKKCSKLPKKVKARIITDYAFRCGVSSTGLCVGMAGGGQWLSYFRRAQGTDPPLDALLVRSPQDMKRHSGGKSYWTNTYSPEMRFWVRDDNFYAIFAWEVCKRSGRRRC